MADSDGEYVDNMSDDDYIDHQVPSGSRQKGRPGIKNLGKAKWEEVSRSWDIVGGAGDDEQSMQATMAELMEHQKRMRVLRDTTPVQRGIYRNLVLVLDMSFAMLERDLLPNRYRVVLNLAREFVREYFEENPISQLGIIAVRDGKAVQLSDLGADINLHLRALDKWRDTDPVGNPSLQNALEMCRSLLYRTPTHGTREVVIVYGAIMTIDPGDISDTISNLVTDRIRVSVVGLAAQMKICQRLCKETNAGDESQYVIALDKDHLQTLLLSWTTPPVARSLEHSRPSLLQMGFPGRITDPPDDQVTYCECHHEPRRAGFRCTRCGAKVCRLPVECPACSLSLINSTHLARHYHHLFPLQTWREVPWSEALRSSTCFSCQAPFPPVPPDQLKSHTTRLVLKKTSGNKGISGKNGNDDTINKSVEMEKRKEQRPRKEGVSESSRYACNDCGNHFCIDCDVYAHEVIHNCAGCFSFTQHAAIEH